MRRYDFEMPLAQGIADYLADECNPSIVCAPPAAGAAATADCLIVPFMDPMSIDDANRVVVEVPFGSTPAEYGVEFEAQAAITVKSQWTQKTLAADMAAHFARVNEVRDKFFSATLAPDVDAMIPDGIMVDFAQQKRNFKTTIFNNGFVTSEADLVFNCHFVDKIQS
jgi:hypothetical protein